MIVQRFPKFVTIGTLKNLRVKFVRVQHRTLSTFFVHAHLPLHAVHVHSPRLGGASTKFNLVMH